MEYNTNSLVAGGSTVEVIETNPVEQEKMLLKIGKL